ncbi:hypothetical protein M378DRAFT_163964 [Amanita muscaria Koide BX008]|uniref:F-box domain-containing protein n=1 Tax=Amanita muscaria (strain Koide BX008) TaxID=946122 RepID=A0A0C2SKM7_AMAMK|nr:hypothetical protein M378DRAFT_163964 [Amanita muscaria Koide BX008]
MSSLAKSLPHDLIREVFKYFAQPFYIHAWYMFPWFLGQISSEWRHIFLSMRPEFWSTIYLNWEEVFYKGIIKPHYALRRHLFKDLVTFFLESDKGHPSGFSFRFTFPTPTDENRLSPDWDLILSIFDKLIDESTRWQDAFIEGPNALASHLAGMQIQIPLLRKLVLYTSTPRDSPCHKAFENAPSLTHLTLSEVSTWKFPWATLTSFCLVPTSGNVYDLLPVLMEMTQLEKLEVRNKYKVNQVSGEIITLPHLKRLDVQEIGWLSILETPSLEHLSIEIDLSSDVPKAVGFLRRSCCSLSHLDVQDCASVMLVQILQNTPTITSLGMWATKDLVASLECLSHGIHQGQEHLLPHLQSLSISTWNILDDEEVEAVCAFVACRGRLGAEGRKHFQSLSISDFDIDSGGSRPASQEKVQSVCDEFDVEFDTL